MKAKAHNTKNGRAVSRNTALVVASQPTAVVVQRGGIDWQHLRSRRPSVLRHAIDLPPYMLLPEVQDLIAMTTVVKWRFLFSTLWLTGARISEALALTKASFVLDEKDPYVSLRTLKTRGRPSKKISHTPARMVPLRDRSYINQVKLYFGSVSLTKTERIFNFTRQAADKQVRALLHDYTEKHGAMSIAVSCHTFRHSFAVNCILHGVPLPVLQGWLGHASMDSTAVYTQVLTAETGHLMDGVEF